MNDNVKKHYNRKLDMILSRYITPRRYGEFCNVIKEIFQRRAYEYEFTEKEMKEQVQNFVKKVKKVQFATKEMFTEGAEGMYKTDNKAIYLNQDCLMELEKHGMSQDEIGERIFETLTHEVYHGIADKDGYMGLSYYDDQTESYKGIALDEIFTEVAADRASKSRTYKEAEMYKSETTGYPDITFVVNLLAASIGVTEKEILKAGIQPGEELMELFASKFSNDDYVKYAKEECFDKLEASLDIVYNAIYDSSEVNYETNSQIMFSALKNLYANAYNLARVQISCDTNEHTQEYISSVTYRFLKMEKIMSDSLLKFEEEGYIDENQIFNAKYMLSSLREDMASKVLELQGVTEKLEDSILAVMADTRDMSYDSFIMQEDFDNGKQWDNRVVARELFSLYNKEVTRNRVEEPQFGDTAEKSTHTEEDLKFVDTDVTQTINDSMNVDKRGLFDKIKETINTFFTRIKNSRLAKLNPPREERDSDKSRYYADLAKSFDKKYAVSPSMLKPMKEVVNESKKAEKLEDKDNQIK